MDNHGEAGGAGSSKRGRKTMEDGRPLWSSPSASPQNVSPRSSSFAATSRWDGQGVEKIRLQPPIKRHPTYNIQPTPP